ncbi:MAG: hypothetical protein ACRC5R_02470 [Mycoplasmatales bacterium]
MKKIALFLFVGILVTSSTIVPLFASTVTTISSGGNMNARGYIGLSGDPEEPHPILPGKNLSVSYDTRAFFKWVKPDVTQNLNFLSSGITMTNNSFYQEVNGSHIPKTIEVILDSITSTDTVREVNFVNTPSKPGDMNFRLNSFWISSDAVTNLTIATIPNGISDHLDFYSDAVMGSDTTNLFTDYKFNFKFKILD